MSQIKKLIEVALPLEKINAESAREKSIRHGHPSTLHLWWARRPLAAARAVIWSSLVDDPSSHPELFPTEEEQNRERQRLFKILEELVVWENSNNQKVLDAAKEEIAKSTNGNPPAFLDPFAGGGAIPLEAQRLGLETHAHDLNPIAVMINKAMVEIPPRFANQDPVNPDDRISRTNGVWHGAQGLAADIHYYGTCMKREAFKSIGHLYPEVIVPKEQGGGKATVIAWISARTVKCPNPVCNCNMPLVSSFVLSKKKGNEAWIEPIFDNGQYRFIVHKGKYEKSLEAGTKLGKKALFCCPHCKTGLVNGDYADQEAAEGRMGSTLLAVVAEGRKGRIYLSPECDSISAINESEKYYEAYAVEQNVPHAPCRGTFASNAMGRRYGFFEFKDYFTKRQLITLTTFNSLIGRIIEKVEKDAVNAGYANDHISLSNRGTGARAYSEAVGVYLSFIISKMADRGSILCGWDSSREGLRNTFGRQAISMAWDYSEGNPFCNSSGCFDNMMDWIVKCVNEFQNCSYGEANQHDAQTDCGLRNIMVSADPPYYGNIDYSDLSDFFYVWMRQTVGVIFPEIFKTLLVPKTEELIATPYRHKGSNESAKAFFENGMLKVCQLINQYAREEVPVTIYYAYKQNESSEIGQINSGWETMLNAIINAGFSITGTWPMRTEMANRAIASGTNALASSIVLVCRKRPEDAPQTTRRNLVNTLRRELRPALKKLQESNIAPVDLAQSAIGPGMGVFSRYRRVLEADGSPMNVGSALHVINEEIDLYFNEQVGDLDAMSRFCVDLYTQNAFNDIKFGDADILARAKGTSVATLASHGVVYAKAGTVHLIERAELPEKIDNNESCIWVLTQQLAQAMATGGVEACAKAVFMIFGSNAERAKDLAYRLYTIAEQKKWADEAYAYNALVVAWPDIQSRAAMMQRDTPEQLDLFSMGLLNT